MGKQQRKKSSKSIISDINRDLMERDKAWDVSLQKLADEWNSEDESGS